MDLQKAENARLILTLQDENDKTLKLLNDAEGKIVLFHEDNKIECLTINDKHLIEKVTDLLKKHFIWHNNGLKKELEEL